MRILSFFVALVVAVAFLGCQDGNSPIAPEHASITPTFVKSASIPGGLLILNAEVSSGYGNVHEIVYDLGGSIRYSLVTEEGGKSILELLIDATLTEKNANGEVKKIQSEKAEYFEALEEITFFSQEFSVDGTQGSLHLFIEFQLSGNQIQVQRVALVDSNEAAG
ncbi:MAG: hypothetical protein KF749_04095 [Bacteroidetes bacterium]|nr:hypothetical protein [Bacteroidota bacterium]MCW5897178.1 hypothetical protein [Bacteroidota bacterium]